MVAVLRHDGEKEDFIELFILMYRKSLNMSELVLIILALKAFVKPFEVPQRSTRMKI